MQTSRFTNLILLCFAVNLVLASCKKSGSSPSSSGPIGGETTETGVDVSGSSSTGGSPGSILIPSETSGSGTTGSTTGTSTQIASLTADNADSNFPPGQLNLEPIELVPIDLTGALALSSSDMDEAEVRFSWNPAQEPLEKANSLLCAFQMLRSGALANQGPYIAKGQFVKNCFTSAKNMGTAAGAGNNKSSNKVPQQAVVVSTKPSAKPMDVNAYITLPYDSISSMGAPAPTGGIEGVKNDANVYLSAKIAEPPSSSNPFGLFRLTYQAFKSVNGAEESDPFWEGYINVTKNVADGQATRDIKLDFHQTISDIVGSTGYRFKNSQTHKATALMTIADQDAAHGKPVDKSVARTATSFESLRIDALGSEKDPAFQDQSGSYTLVYTADAQRSLTKWTRAPGTQVWWNVAPPVTPPAFGEGSACTDADSNQLCDGHEGFSFCDGFASNDPSCVMEGDACTDVVGAGQGPSGPDGYCDERPTYRYCSGIAREKYTCLYVGATCTEGAAGFCAEDPSFKYCSGVAKIGSCIAAGDACTDANNNGFCDEDTAFKYCDGIARTGSMCPFDPEEATCRSTNQYSANVYQYGLFDNSGSRIYHSTGYSVQTGKTDAWGWPISGWLGNGGLWLSGVRHGDQVSIHDPNWANPKNLTFHDIPGTLRTDNWQLAKAENDFYLICTSSPSSCPNGNVGENGSVTAATHSIVITADTNDKIVFDVDHSSNSGERVATISPNTYSPDSLAAEIATQLGAACAGYCGSASFTVNYGSDKRFSFSMSGASALNLRWTDSRSTLAPEIGFNQGSDDTGWTYHTSDKKIGPIYRYDVSELALYQGVNKIKFADGVKTSSLYLDFEVQNAGGNSNINVGNVFRYDMYQSAWQGMNLSANDNSWLNLYDFSSWESGKYTNIALTCSTCPKDTISRSDVTGSSYSQAGPLQYYFNMSDWSLYRKVGANEDPANDIKIRFADDVEVANLNFEMNIVTGSNQVAVKFNMFAQMDPGAGALWDSNANQYFWAPDPIKLVNRVLTSADQYDQDETNSYVGQNTSALSWAGTLSFDGWGLCCIDWESKPGKKDNWGNPMHGPKFTFAKGTDFVAANSAGSVIANNTYQIAPLWTEIIPDKKTDCPSSMQSDLSAANHSLAMPEPMEAAKQNVKSLLPAKPKFDSNGNALKVRIVDSQCAAFADDGSCL
jgi:hypothetical protein